MLALSCASRLTRNLRRYIRRAFLTSYISVLPINSHCSLVESFILSRLYFLNWFTCDLLQLNYSKMPAKRKAAAVVPTEDASGDTNWADCTVAELKEELERRGLSKGGKKGDLVARLEDNDEDTLAAVEPAAELAPKAKKAKKSKKEVSPDAETEGPTAAELVENQQRSASGEKRSRPFVPAPDDEYKKKLKKVKKERMFMLDRTKSVDSQGVACEIFDIAGSTGNIYQTTFGRSPKCTCMDAVSTN
jgi:hypothetical protein